MLAVAAALLLSPLPYTGTNLSGADFGDAKDRVYDKTYTYPNEKEVAYFAAWGMNVFRIGFLWESMQPKLMGDLDPTELARLTAVVDAVGRHGGVAILDPHDYARRDGHLIGSAEVTDGDFADFWGRLARRFKARKDVWLGLMNEPHDLPTTQWLRSANGAISAIRRQGAKNLVLVPGNGWTGAHSWRAAGNDEMLGVIDPADHYAFEAHQYLDVDSSGTHDKVVSPTIGSERLRDFVLWCRTHHKRAFLGEFATASDEVSHAAMDDMLRAMERDRDVWLGFTWWSAGPWWGDYMYSLEPKDGKDRPQLSWLRPYLQRV